MIAHRLRGFGALRFHHRQYDEFESRRRRWKGREKEAVRRFFLPLPWGVPFSGGSSSDSGAGTTGELCERDFRRARGYD